MAGIAGRGGANGGIAAEKLEVLWGSRGNPREHALRRGELVDIQRVIAETKKSLADLKTALTAVKNDLDQLTIKVDEIDSQLDGIEDRITAAQTALTQLEQLIASIEGRLTGIDDSIATLQVDVSHLQTDITDLQGSVNGVTTDLSFLQAEVGELELGLSSLTVTSDLNTAVRNKEFQWSNTSTNSPIAGSSGRGFTIASSPNDITQVGIINGTGQIFVRYRTPGAWSIWADVVSLRAEPFALQSNPGATTFPAGAYTAIPLFTSTELSGGIVKAGNSTFTLPQAGLYQFELELRVNGGAANQPPVGASLGLTIDGTTIPTSLRAGHSAVGVAAAITIIRLGCTERLAAGDQRVPYILNQGAAAYQVASAVLKITRLSA